MHMGKTYRDEEEAAIMQVWLDHSLYAADSAVAADVRRMLTGLSNQALDALFTLVVLGRRGR